MKFKLGEAVEYHGHDPELCCGIVGQVTAMDERTCTVWYFFDDRHKTVPVELLVQAERHQVEPENAAKFLDWLRTRGGIAIWNSADLSNPGQTWSAPLNDEQGQRKSKPHWSCGRIIRLITDPAEIEVVEWREFKRFRVAVRVGSLRLKLKLTSAASAKLRRVCENAKAQHGESSYAFDYFSQEAVVLVPGRKVLLSEWVPEPQEVSA